MRKLFKKTTAAVLTAAMAITGAAAIAPAATKTAKAADTDVVYNAYTAFQVSESWASRSNWADSKQGLNGGKDYTVKNVGNVKSATYNYLKQFLVFNKDEKQNIVDGNITDAKINQNGTYTMEIGNCPIAGFAGMESKEAKWNMLSICTDIPTSEKNVKCTNAKVYFDDETTPFAELANVPYNKEDTNNGVLDFFIFDAYADTHETKGVLDCAADKYKKFPKKSMKIEFTISGIDFSSKKDVVVDNGLLEGQSFTSGDYKYKVVTRSKSDGTKGTVAIAGLSSAAAKKTSLTTPTVATNTDGCKYTVTNIAKEAFAGNKVLKSVKLGSTIKTIGTGAFKKCTKLTGITCNKKVTSVGTSVFEGCTSLSKITLGSKVKSIKKSAFKNCTKLSKITISQKVKVAKGAFTGCKKTITISGKKANKTYTVDQVKKSGYKKVK